jgi:hypothetical protein
MMHFEGENSEALRKEALEQTAETNSGEEYSPMGPQTKEMTEKMEVWKAAQEKELADREARKENLRKQWESDHENNQTAIDKIKDDLLDSAA